MNETKDFNWNAVEFFRSLTAANKLARQERFVFCRVSGLDGFEEALAAMQGRRPVVCVSDIAPGYTALDTSPMTSRLKTVFLAMPHPIDDMGRRGQCFDTLRELFRQFMSRLIMERVALEQLGIFLDPRVQFTEIPQYFYNGCACAYFSITTSVYTDLRFNPEEWEE